jgi:hypothetical protein
LVDYDLRGQSIVFQLGLPLDPVEFLVKHLELILELISTSRATLIELGVVTSRGGTIRSFLGRLSRAIALVLW